MSSRVPWLLLLLMTACASPEPPRRPPARYDSPASCGRPRLSQLVRDLGGRLLPSRDFRGRVPVGEPEHMRAAVCEPGEPLGACEDRFQRPLRAVFVHAETETRFVMHAVEPASPMERELARSIEGDARFELGQREQREVVTDRAVCVQTFRTRQVRLQRQVGTGARMLELLEARAAESDLVFDLSEPDRFSVRCASADELIGAPAVPSTGPCSRVASR
ncbi:MAG: hypothetical protein AB8I08_21600 [Sandaracinaceae bacterium]